MIKWWKKKNNSSTHNGVHATGPTKNSYRKQQSVTHRTKKFASLVANHDPHKTPSHSRASGPMNYDIVMTLQWNELDPRVMMAVCRDKFTVYHPTTTARAEITTNTVIRPTGHLIRISICSPTTTPHKSPMSGTADVYTMGRVEE